MLDQVRCLSSSLVCYMTLNFDPDMSTQTVSVTFSTLAEALTCEACKQGLKLRVKDIITKWALLRVRVPLKSFIVILIYHSW